MGHSIFVSDRPMSVEEGQLVVVEIFRPRTADRDLLDVRLKEYRGLPAFWRLDAQLTPISWRKWNAMIGVEMCMRVDHIDHKKQIWLKPVDRHTAEILMAKRRIVTKIANAMFPGNHVNSTDEFIGFLGWSGVATSEIYRRLLCGQVEKKVLEKVGHLLPQQLRLQFPELLGSSLLPNTLCNWISEEPKLRNLKAFTNALKKKNKLDKAVDMLRDARGDPKAWREVERVLSSSPFTRDQLPSGGALELFQGVHCLVVEGNGKEAREIFERVVSEGSWGVIGNYYLGMACVYEVDRPGAIACFLKCIRYPPALRQLSIMCIEAADPDLFLAAKLALHGAFNGDRKCEKILSRLFDHFREDITPCAFEWGPDVHSLVSPGDQRAVFVWLLIAKRNRLPKDIVISTVPYLISSPRREVTTEVADLRKLLK